MSTDPTEPDLERLAELSSALGESVASIAEALMSDLDRELSALDVALTEGNLGAATRGAHAARNAALMLDDRSLLEPLRALETAARGGELQGAVAAHATLRERWPRLRGALQRAAAAG